MLGGIVRYGDIVVDTTCAGFVGIDNQFNAAENENLEIEDVKKLVDQLSAWVGIKEA